ncbi:protein phosphatase 2C 63 [Populus alba x Populus x berolinensis]|uniref:protein-serine/threonine phosphatase n=2 Tax=Populus alba x Populus x berolinensis TaxID=444605 RepID=A0AAD6RRY6_9ROSI|nr:protein phosphatase 2C 63 [Populus alba x Populus x berolinensis]
MMLRSCYRPLERCFGRVAGGGGDGLMWHADLKQHASGDYSIAVVQANSNLEDQSQVFTSPSATYVGVYDGHGGPEASRFVNKHLFPFMHKFAKEHGGLSADVIKKAFNATEEEFCHLVKRSLPLKPQIASVGSCCLVGAISNDVLYVANLGDSRAVLGRRVDEDKKKTVVAERLSTDHNVAVEEVRKEVEALHPDDSHIVVYTRGVWRIKGIIQASVYGGNTVVKVGQRVSRSIGDVYLKKPEFNRDPIYQQFGNPIPLKRPVMTAEPSIVFRKLRSEDLFLIFASDGLWEQLTDEAAVEIVFKNPRAGIAKRLVRAAIQEAAKKREMRYNDIKKIEKGIRRHFHDDITVIVIYLDHQKGSSNGRLKNNAIGCTSAPVDIFSRDADQAEVDMLQTIS